MLDDTVSAQPEPEGIPVFPLLAAADLQDHLMTVTNDLERLQRLLDDAGESLMAHFYGATSHLNRLQTRAAELPDFDLTDVLRLKDEMAGAITALQFQDMATQLIAHTSQRLRNCADQLAQDTFGDDEEGAAVVQMAPLKPNPVTQDEMDAGSIELF